MSTLEPDFNLDQLLDLYRRVEKHRSPEHAETVLVANTPSRDHSIRVQPVRDRIAHLGNKDRQQLGADLADELHRRAP